MAYEPIVPPIPLVANGAAHVFSGLFRHTVTAASQCFVRELKSLSKVSFDLMAFGQIRHRAWVKGSEASCSCMLVMSSCLASREPLGSSFGPSWGLVGGFLEPAWRLFGASWRLRGPLGWVLGPRGASCSRGLEFSGPEATMCEGCQK
eukprot:2269537-Pyramimonas_sp.AAC.2